MPPIVLVGSEFEENLSIRYLAAAVEAEGFTAELVPFNDPSQLSAVAARIAAYDPLVVGISVPFQLRAASILKLAQALREKKFAGHITVGGHFVTFEYANILRDFPDIDSVVRHEGEIPFRTLCLRLRDGRDIGKIPGVVARAPLGTDLIDGGTQPLPPLDDLPFPDRRGEPHEVMGVPTAPIVGSRGCYADCTFCCIYAYAENADGARYRRRSPGKIVAEMEQEYHRRGVRLFVFHDDNFFVPSQPKNLARYREMAALIDAANLTDIGLVIKCRPNDVDPELFRLLKSMGMIRAYVGIETNSDEGVISLNRRITPQDNRRALRVLEDLDVYRSFNVLIFDPEATLRGVEANLDFMEEFADTPFNFCRAEVYAGTPLKNILAHQERLQGDYFAWGYQMRDPRVELLFRIATTAFHTRNFKSDGVANLNMGIRFDNEVARHFFPASWDEDWQERLRWFSREVGLNSVRLMRDALAFARQADLVDNQSVKDFTRELAQTVARADLEYLRECKALRRELERRVLTSSGDRLATTFGRGMPVWAAETVRPAESTGREVSTEVLPQPARL